MFEIKNKSGLSGVITVVLLIALVFATVAVVWVVVDNLVRDKLQGAGDCLDIFDKTSLNPLYTCYNSTSNELRFSVSVGDAEVNKVIVAISAGGSTNSYTLTDEGTVITGLRNYPGDSTTITIPGRNSGKTYIASGVSSSPDLIQLAPVVGGENCGVSDTISDVGPCSSLVS